MTNLLSVAIVAHDKMADWLERLSSVGIKPVALKAENQGLARIPGTLSMLVDDETIQFNDGANDEFVMQDVQPSDVLVVAGQLGEKQNDDGASAGHAVIFCTPEKDKELAHEWIALRHEDAQRRCQCIT